MSNRYAPYRDDRRHADDRAYRDDRSRNGPPAHAARRSRSPDQRHPRDNRGYRREYDQGPSRSNERYDSQGSRGSVRDDYHRRDGDYDRRDAYRADPRSRPESSRGQSSHNGRAPPPLPRQDRASESEGKAGANGTRDPNAIPAAATSDTKTPEPDHEEGENGEEEDMMKAMGFGGFGTTKGTKVKGNQTGLAEVKKERTWRQYMQRKGGFNRPLSPVRK